MSILEIENLRNNLSEYIEKIENIHAHSAKMSFFFNFLEQNFKISSYLLLEKMESPINSKILGVKGSIDSIIGSLIIEFKTNFLKELDDAKEQLLKYFQGLKEKDPENEYLGLISDGIYYKIYRGLFDGIKIKEIIEIDELNLKAEKNNFEKIFLWFDKYFFISEKIKPSTNQFKSKFGINSPTYILLEEKFLKLLEKVWNEPSVKNKFNNWERYLEIVYGSKLTDKNLFIKHTYLANFAKLIIFSYFFKRIPKKEEIILIYSGKSFEKYGLLNFIEDDFFAWIMNPKIIEQVSGITFQLLKEIRIFDLSVINEDIFKGLYQELVDPEVRHDLGEYYTPDWLAEYIIEKINSSGKLKSLLDPSCGSGTFLFSYINHLISKNSKKDKLKLLNWILNNVIGIDIHPLAIIIAKANYLLALQKIIPNIHEPYSIPIYLGDSINLPKIKSDILSTVKHYSIIFPLNDNGVQSKYKDKKNIIIKPIKKKEDEKIKGFEFKIPYRCNKSPQILSGILEIINDYLINLSDKDFNLEDELSSFRHVISKEKYQLNQAEIEIFVEDLKILYDLLLKGQDSIWIYVIRNIYHTILSQYRKFQLVVGNPPWLLLRFIRNIDYQKVLKNFYFKYNLLDKKDTHFMTNLELASIFFYKSFDNFVKIGGKIGFILPKSILSSIQYVKFRKFSSLNIKLNLIIDLENVSPLFKMSACSIIGEKINNNIKVSDIYPTPLETISGELREKNCKLTEARRNLTISPSQYTPPEVEKPLEKSDYYDEFKQGATFNPMCFYFVEIPSHNLGISKDAPFVQTKENKYAKKPWKDIKIEANIEKKFLFGTVLSGDIIPFYYTKLVLLICPIEVDNSGKINLFKSYKDSKAKGYTKISQYLKNIERLWFENTTEKSRKMSIYQRIDYQNGLSKQNLKSNYRILYTAIGTNLNSCIINQKQKFFIEIDGINHPLEGIISDNSTYYYETNDENEAYYISTILNSDVLNDLIKPFQSRGQWGARNIHKLPLKFPIPKYSNVKNKNKLAFLGKSIEEKVSKNIEIIKKYKSSAKRREISKSLIIDELIEVDRLTRLILNL